jgi:hypothetical protein
LVANIAVVAVIAGIGVIVVPVINSERSELIFIVIPSAERKSMTLRWG